jgi:hypothetical protein
VVQSLLYRPLTGIAVLLAVAGAIAAWGLVGRTLAHVKPVPVRGSFATGFLWADRVFTDQSDFARWLQRRGASYSHWAKFHPQDDAILESRP